MRDIPTYAMSYELDYNIQTREPIVQVIFSWVVGDGKGVAIKAPERWECKLPTDLEFTDFLLGTSETRGILGGVHHPFLEAQSETIERLLGDALTTCVADILDNIKGDAIILVLGPAFPKVLGRFLSLKPPDYVDIAWVVPANAPNERIGYLWRLLMPFSPHGHPSEWNEEALLNSICYPEDIEPIFWIQYLERRNSEVVKQRITDFLDSPEIKLNYRKIRDTDKQLSQALLPREIILAMDVPKVVENSQTNIWTSDDGSRYLDLSENSLPAYLSRSLPRGKPLYSWNNEALLLK